MTWVSRIQGAGGDGGRGLIGKCGGKEEGLPLVAAKRGAGGKDWELLWRGWEEGIFDVVDDDDGVGR